ncbi:MAG: phosphoglycerate kinase, partial [Acetobacteraceae bacterium]
ALAAALGRPVQFASDCIGEAAGQAAAALGDGDVLLLENTRFHAGEEANEPGFAKALAGLADLYVDDAFSAAHRAHASTEGVAHLLPSYAGREMAAELAALQTTLGNPQRPFGAIVGGAKVSTKLEVLGTLCGKVDLLLIGGAMANTFLAAKGLSVGRSLEEPEQHQAALKILAEAKVARCAVLLPVDAVVAAELAPGVATTVVPIEAVPAEMMILDLGPKSVEAFKARLGGLRTLVWNGPVGAFETPPFAAGTLAIAEAVADATAAGGLCSVGGGGDTLAALNVAKVADRLTYVSTAGGAFLEWLEGKPLPGVVVLTN